MSGAVESFLEFRRKQAFSILFHLNVSILKFGSKEIIPISLFGLSLSLMGLLVAWQPLLENYTLISRLKKVVASWVRVFLGLVWSGTLLFKSASVNYAKDLPWELYFFIRLYLKLFVGKVNMNIKEFGPSVTCVVKSFVLLKSQQIWRAHF